MSREQEEMVDAVVGRAFCTRHAGTSTKTYVSKSAQEHQVS